jgi:hypothetical protein
MVFVIKKKKYYNEIILILNNINFIY